jgi:D-alanyl-D-alanine carboxypeptidase/D-alanyl-D-alanine-endopeptidase (penicillin-binding protein 4)
VRGDDSAGTAVVKKWLEEHNIATNEIAIHDGSGLSRLDFVSPEVFARALVFASQTKGFYVFKNSLPLAAVDGTLKGRFQNLSGKVAAKTGSSTYVNSLAGYARSESDEVFAFAVIVNNETQKADSIPLIDSIVSNLAK